jgi:hypothetical protein
VRDQDRKNAEIPPTIGGRDLQEHDRDPASQDHAGALCKMDAAASFRREDVSFIDCFACPGQDDETDLSDPASQQATVSL